MIKKFLSLIAIASLTAFVMVSCDKQTTDPEEDDPNKENPEPEPEPEPFTIKLDGVFDEWDSEEVSKTTAAEEGTYITDLRAYCDAENLYLYFATPDITQIHNFRILVDTDGDLETGTPEVGHTTYIVSTGYSVMINMSGLKKPSDAAAYSDMYGGDTMVGTVNISGKSVVNEDNSAQSEFAITRASLEAIAPIEARALRLCVFSLNPSWSVSGSIPSPKLESEGIFVKVNN